MAFAGLPFQPQHTGKNLFGGEPVAPKWKRIAAGAVDYGPLMVGYGFAYAAQNRVEYGDPNPAAVWLNLLPLVLFLNSGVFAGIWGQSLGKAMTGITLVMQVGRRLEVPGVLRGILRVLVPLLLLYSAHASFAVSRDTSDPNTGGSILTGILLLSYAIFFFDSKGRHLFDHLTKSAVIDVDIHGRNRGEDDNPAVRRPFG